MVSTGTERPEDWPPRVRPSSIREVPGRLPLEMKYSIPPVTSDILRFSAFLNISGGVRKAVKQCQNCSSVACLGYILRNTLCRRTYCEGLVDPTKLLSGGGEVSQETILEPTEV